MTRAQFALIAAAALSACVAAVPGSSLRDGRMTFADNCAACHGDTAKGGGEFGMELIRIPPDLTGLSARNGGTFPAAHVVGVLEGHARNDDFSAAMPTYAVSGMGSGPVATVDGVDHPVNAQLAGLLRYLETLQD